MICNRCGKMNGDAARFCISCGAPLEAQDTPRGAATASFCGRCGRETVPDQTACSACGTPGGMGDAFCRSCGGILTPGAVHCPRCRAAVPQPAKAPACAGQGYTAPPAGAVPPPPPYGAPPSAGYAPPPAGYAPPSGAYPCVAQKSKVVAGVLGIFFGVYGVHNFYLGYTQKAIIQLVVTLAGLALSFFVVPLLAVAAMGIWGFVEAIMILAGSIAVDGRGIPLRN